MVKLRTKHIAPYLMTNRQPAECIDFKKDKLVPDLGTNFFLKKQIFIILNT